VDQIKRVVRDDRDGEQRKRQLLRKRQLILFSIVDVRVISMFYRRWLAVLRLK
jgi:hypothetical protein